MVRDGRNRDTAPDPRPQFTSEELQTGDALFPHSVTVYGALREGDHPTNIVMDIFVWKGETFVIMRPYLWVRDISPTWAIYQLQPDHSVREVCVLDRVPINY